MAAPEHPGKNEGKQRKPRTLLDIDLDELAFPWESPTLGSLTVMPLSMRHMEALRYDEDTHIFISDLIKAVVRRDKGEISDDDIARLPDQEREAFATLFLDHNQDLFRERIEEVHEDEAGARVTSYREGDVIHPRVETETKQSYVHRLLRLQRDKFVETYQQIVEPIAGIVNAARQQFMSPAFLDSMKAFREASARLGETIRAARMPSIGLERESADEEQGTFFGRPSTDLLDMEIPEHPGHETNRRLDNVAQRLATLERLGIDMAETVQKVSDAAGQFLVDFQRAAQNADTASRRAIRIAVAAILVTLASGLLHIGYAEWRATRNDEASSQAIGAVSSQLSEILNAHQQTAALLRNDLPESNRSIAGRLEDLSEAVQSLATELPASNQAIADQLATLAMAIEALRASVRTLEPPAEPESE